MELRNEWASKMIWDKHPQFREQICMCTRQHIKSQHECLLRQLQIAYAEGLIRLSPSKNFTSDESRSFLGWTGFEVAPYRCAEFRRRIEGMFAHAPQERTLNNTLRRAGLVPEGGWSAAWSGDGAFVFDKDTRVRYGGKRVGELEDNNRGKRARGELEEKNAMHALEVMTCCPRH